MQRQGAEEALCILQFCYEPKTALKKKSFFFLSQKKKILGTINSEKNDKTRRSSDWCGKEQWKRSHLPPEIESQGKREMLKEHF